MSAANDSLRELLKDNGISKSDLAALMGVSRQTVQRMGDKVTPEAREAIEGNIVTEKVWEITHRNIALSRIKYGREGMPIDDVAKLFRLSVFQYNKEVDKTIKYCAEKGTSFAELRE